MSNIRPMRALNRWILASMLTLAAAFPPAAPALEGPVVATDNVKARLISENSAIGPGQSIWVALELDIRDGWHTYWRNPGDSGQATSIQWTLPPGFSAGDIVWTAPHRFEVPPLVNYGYAKRALHLVQITAPATLQSGHPATLQGKASWLVCSDVCIPEDVVLKLTLPTGAGPGALDPSAAASFAEARQDLPNAAPAPTSVEVGHGQVVLTLGKEWGTTLSQIKSLAFFPYDEGGIEYAAPQTLSRTKDSVQLTVKAGYQPPKVGPVRGILLATEDNGGTSVTVPLEISATLSAAAGKQAGVTAETPAAGAPAVEAPAAQGARATATAETPALASLVLLAILGGLILNLMPCVFPVLSIKAIGLVEQSRKNPAAVRAKGLVFAAGVIASMLSLAVVLLALRAGGEEIGWGFQLQSPLFVTLMVYLLMGIGLNLSGVFEVGGGLAGMGDGLTQGEGYRAAFFTGVLTTLVATPCTAPFMAAAVGAALTQPPAVALSIFASVGMGLSLPYLMLSFAPWTRRILPTPGAWMDTLKQIFAFPMYASAAWLLWVLAQQTSSLGLGAALAGALLIALAAWAYQKSKFSGFSGRAVALCTAILALLLALFLPWRYADVAAAAPAGTSAARESESWQPYDAARVAELVAQGRPLLVNFTASWCLTCLVNERNAFSDSTVQALFHDKGVTLMKGDWTNRDPAITKALADFHRGGVPLYLVYNAKPGSTQPQVLPQLLTAGIVRDAFASRPVDTSRPGGVSQ